jgi:hypothetical protein
LGPAAVDPEARFDEKAAFFFFPSVNSEMVLWKKIKLV